MDINWNKGINDKQIDQLIEYSQRDENIGKFTSDKERFKNREAFEEWTKKKRTVFTLSDTLGNLLGIIWLGPKPLPTRKYQTKVDSGKYQTSFAIRIYGEARGKGLALDFMKRSIDTEGIWLEVSEENIAAKSLYSKFGFCQVSQPDENNKIIMIY